MTTLEVPTKLYEAAALAAAALSVAERPDLAAAVRQLRDLCTSQHLAHEATVGALEEAVRKLVERDALLARAQKVLTASIMLVPSMGVRRAEITLRALVAEIKDALK